jgi:tetratricopeptide (TPR) repeat protein
MPRLASLAVFALAATSALTASSAFAANPKATQLAKDADRLYKDGKYRDAAEALKQAYELDKNPVFLFNIARAYDQAGDLQLALDTYRQYVGLPDTDPQLVKRANLAMDRLRALVARSEADKQVQEAESRRLKDEAEAARRKAEEEAERARKQKEEFEAKEAARAREQNKGAGGRRIAGIVLGVLALGAVGAGVGFGVTANSAKTSFSSAATLEDKQRFQAQTKQAALIADLSLAAALALGITFAIVFPWASLGSSDVHVAFAPNGASIGGTF